MNIEYLFMCFFCSLLLKEVPSNCLSFMSHKTWIFPGIQAPRCEGLENTNQSKGELPVSRFRDLLLCYFPFVSHVVERSCGVREWVREGRWGRWMDGWRGEGRKDGNRERQDHHWGKHGSLFCSQSKVHKSPPFSSALMLKSRKEWVNGIQLIQIEQEQSTSGRKEKCYRKKRPSKFAGVVMGEVTHSSLSSLRLHCRRTDLGVFQEVNLRTVQKGRN